MVSHPAFDDVFDGILDSMLIRLHRMADYQDAIHRQVTGLVKAIEALPQGEALGLKEIVSSGTPGDLLTCLDEILFERHLGPGE